MNRSSSYNDSNLHEENPETARRMSRDNRDYRDSRDYSYDNRNYSRDYAARDYHRGTSHVTDDGTHSGKWTSTKEVSDRDMNRRAGDSTGASNWHINMGPMFPRNTQSYNRYDNSYDYDSHPSLSSMFHRGSRQQYDRDYDDDWTTGRSAYTTSNISYPSKQYYTSSSSSYPQHGQFMGLGSFLTSHPNPHPIGGDFYGSQQSWSRPQYYGSDSSRGFSGSHGQYTGLGSFLTSHPNPHPIGGDFYGNQQSWSRPTQSRGFDDDFIDFSDSYYGNSRYGSSGYGSRFGSGLSQTQGLGAFMMSHPNPHPIGGSSNFGDFSTRGFSTGSQGQYTGLGSFLTSHPNPHPLGSSNFGDFSSRGFERQSYSSSNPFTNQYQYGDYQSSGSEFRNKQHKIDMYQVSNDYVIEMDLPGFTRDAVEIKFLNNELIISARPPQRNISNFMQRERKIREVCRKVQMPSGINASGINAVLANGVLKVTVPRDNASTMGNVSSSTF